MRNRTIFTYSVLLIIFVTAISIFAIFTYFYPEKHKIVESVTKIDYTYKNEFVGTIQSSKTLPLYIDSNAIIDEVFVEEGSLVKKGDKLVSFTKGSSSSIDKSLKINELDIEEALLKLDNLQNGTSKLELDTKNLEIKNIADQIKASNRKIPILRNEAIALRKRADALFSLFEQGGVSAIESTRASTEASRKEDELEDMKMNLELLKQKYSLTFLGYESLKRDINMQKVQLNSALSKLNIIRNDLMKKKKELDNPLISPVNGIILKEEVFSGKNISPGDTILTLVEKGNEIVSFKVPLSEIKLINGNKKIEISSFDSQDTPVVATIKRVSNLATPSSNNEEKSVDVELNLPPTNNFNLGYNVNISVIGNTYEDIPVVKQKALFVYNNLPYILISKDGSVEKFKISTGKKLGDYIEVTNLPEGTKYIVNYADFTEK